MKKLSCLLTIIILVVVFLFSGCMAIYMSDEDNPCIGMNQAQIGFWISQNIAYKADGIIDYVQSPKETLSRRKGDCEDFSVLYIWLVYENLDLKLDMVTVPYNEKMTHKMVLHGDKLIEPQQAYAYTSYSPVITIHNVEMSYSQKYSMEDVLYITPFYSVFVISTMCGLKGVRGE